MIINFKILNYRNIFRGGICNFWLLSILKYL